MEQNTTDMVTQYAEWLELDDIDKGSVIHIKEKRQEVLADTMMTIAECLSDTTPSQYQQHLRGVARGMLDVCLVFDVFTRKEYEVLKDILSR